MSTIGAKALYKLLGSLGSAQILYGAYTFVGQFFVKSNILKFGTVDYPTSYEQFLGSAYITLDKITEEDDCSLVYRQGGAVKWEVGATTELPGAANDYHIKRCAGAAGAESFVDVFMIDHVTSNTYIPDGFKFGVGTLPVELVHISRPRPSSRLIAKMENGNYTGIGSKSTCWQFAGQATTWNVGNDYGLTGGDDFFIQSNAGLKFYINQYGVAVGGGSYLNPTEVFRVDSTTQGILPPRLTTAQRDAMGGKDAGLFIYNSTTGKPETWNGAAWVSSSGDVSGPASSVDLTFALFDGVTGKLLKQASNITQDAAGIVSLGDGSTPAAGLISSDRFVVSREANALGISGIVASATALHRTVFKGVRARGTLAAPTAPSAGDYALSFLAAIWDGAAVQATGEINFIVDGAVSAGVAPCRIGFFTSTTTGAARTEKMSLFANGNLSIGSTTDTGEKLQVTGQVANYDGNVPAAGITSLARYVAYQQETSAGTMAGVMAGSLASHRPVWRGLRSRGTLAAPTALADGDNVAGFRGAGYDGATAQDNGEIKFIVDGAVSSGVVPMRIGFFLSATNTAGVSEKASLFSDGNFSVGSTTNTGEKLQVTGTSKLGTVTSGTWNGTAIAATYGGTGLASYTTGNYINAASASALQERTPAQVLTDINGVAATAVNVPATDTETSYPNNSVSTGSMTAGGPMSGGIGTHLTAESNTGTRVAQFAFNAAGGTTLPDVWFRTSHPSVGGGGFTPFYKLLHYGTFEPYTVTTVTAGYTETAAYGDKIIRCNLAAGFTVVLPSAVTSKARLTFKKIDPAGTIVLDGASTQTIDGALTISLTAQYESVTLVSDGANWMII